MTDYGTEAWKSYLEVLVKCVASAQTQVTKLKYALIFKIILLYMFTNDDVIF